MALGDDEFWHCQYKKAAQTYWQGLRLRPWWVRIWTKYLLLWTGGVGVSIDGCPPLIELSEADIQRDLDRRRPGQSEIVTPRAEEDRCQILSGVFEGKTLGTPISMMVENEDQRSEAYTEMATKFRPSHADYTYQAKFGIRAWPGGGRTSARETIGRVAAGAIAKKLLRERHGIEILAYVA